jgi:hypothetical protein
MAARLWPNQDPIGKEFRLAADPQRGWITVIGVSGDVANWDSSDRPLPTAYVDATSLPAFPAYFFIRNLTGERIPSDEPLARAIDSLKYTIEGCRDRSRRRSDQRERVAARLSGRRRP